MRTQMAHIREYKVLSLNLKASSNTRNKKLGSNEF